MHQETGTTSTAHQSPTEDSEAVMICCDTYLDIAGAHALYSRLHAALTAHQPVLLDATHVERIDTAVLQMLCAFIRDAQARGMVVQWHQPSPGLRHAARLLNVSALLALPAA